MYQCNSVLFHLQGKQNRNKINNLSDSPFFAFHLVSSFALGRTKSVFQAIFPDNQSLFWEYIVEAHQWIVAAKRENEPKIIFRLHAL